MTIRKYKGQLVAVLQRGQDAHVVQNIELDPIVKDPVAKWKPVGEPYPVPPRDLRRRPKGVPPTQPN